MPQSSDPKPKKGLLRSGSFSPMKFMAEQLIFDSETDSFVRFFGSFQMPKWDGVESSEIDHVIEGSAERLDKLANYYYSGRVELWWVIAARNNLDLHDVSLYQGMRLKIPSQTWVDSYLLKQSSLISKD